MTSSMMKKKATYTHITPIPSFIPRQLAIDILHSHGEIIELNPLVTGFEAIKAPRDAPSDEFYATWYEISQKIQYIPGVGKLGSGSIKFKGCFHDMPWGLQTHTYAPAGVDMRNKWKVAGNQPGEPPETRELGLDAPPEGLYLREDIEIKCNVTMISFVKKEMKAASKILVERLIKKAELLDSGALSAMMQNGKLKTINPADRSTSGAGAAHQQNSHSPQPSPRLPYHNPLSPMQSPTFAPQQTYQQQQQGGYYHQQQYQQYHQKAAEVQNNQVAMELPGDFHYAAQHQQPSPSHLQASQPNDNRYSTVSELSNHSNHSPHSNDGRWSQPVSENSRPSSFAPSEGMRSPPLDQKSFAAELPTMQEMRDEDAEARKQLESGKYPDEKKYAYNPQDFAQHPSQRQQQQQPSHQYQQHNQQQQQGAPPPQYSTYGSGR